MDTMTIENVYGQDVVNQGALYLTLLAKAVINIDGGRSMNEEDDSVDCRGDGMGRIVF